MDSLEYKKQKSREYAKEYYKTHKDKYRKIFEKYYLIHSKEAKKRSKEYYLRNKDNKEFRLGRNAYSREWMKTPKGIYKVLKQNSKKRKREFVITQDEFFSWYYEQKKECYYCEIPENKLFIEKETRLEIERLNNDLPYQIGNIVLACSWCNGVKGNILTESEMKIIGYQIIKQKWQKLR